MFFLEVIGGLKLKYSNSINFVGKEINDTNTNTAQVPTKMFSVSAHERQIS